MKDRIYTITGIAIMIVALVVFQINGENIELLSSILLFTLTLIQFVILLITRNRRKKQKLELNMSFDWLVLLTIFEISAFNLNKTIPIFQHSAAWVSIVLVSANIALGYLLYPNKRHNNVLLENMAITIATFSIPLFIYFTLYLFPYFAFSLIGILFFGLSSHVFAPLLITIFFIYQLNKLYSLNSSKWKYMAAGLTGPIVISILFIFYWENQTTQIKKIINHNIINETNELPTWVKIAQQIPKNAITEKILKTGIVYPELSGSFSFFDNPLRSQNNEVPKHDPLVVISNLFITPPSLENTEKLKIIKNQYGRHYEFNEHLWGDEELQTSSIVTNVLLMPQYRMAYTEKTITIQNKNEYNAGEAIYTFKLPSNSAVSSLSLWINGEERKAAITTKLKAESAYKQIVGVENRDPVTVSWKEGNSVIVRVFPCTKNDPRKFKLGITSPLLFNSNSNTLTYKNISFEGPNSKDALESIKFHTEIAVKDVTSNNISNQFDKIIDQDYTENWSLSFKAPPLSSNSFTFQDFQYNITNIQKTQTKSKIENLYLDINSSWTTEEIDNILKSPGKKYVYFNSHFVEQSENQFQDAITNLKELNFSVFPFHKISNINTDLVVTKNSSNTPNIEDLRLTNFKFNEYDTSKSEYYIDLKKFLQLDKKVNVYALDNHKGNLLNSLSDIHSINCFSGSSYDLIKFLKQNQHLTDINNDSIISIPNASISILKTKNKQSHPTGSNHIMRLFAYNHTMQDLGKKYITQPEKVSESEIQEAIESNVVTPVSNLIVLETTEDYKRFNIKEHQNNSLENANMKSSGSVPEPSEWFLIILGITIVIGIYFKQWK